MGGEDGAAGFAAAIEGPNEHIDSAALARVSHLGNGWQQAVRILHSMGDVRLNVFCYSAAIGACGRSGEYEVAIELLDEMTRAGVWPNLIVYNTAINAAAKAAKTEQAMQLFDDMLAAGLKPDTNTFWSLVKSCRRRGEWELAVG